MATKSQKIPFGLKGQLMVSIAEVQSGLACGCHCPACGEPLIARKGLKNVHHFAHHSESACASAFETSVHLMAKQIIAEEKKFKTPQTLVSDYHFNPMGTRVARGAVIPKTSLSFTSVATEETISSMRIDSVGRQKQGQVLLIEVYVTHKVSEEKKEKIRSLGLSAIEVDLSGVDYNITRDELKELVVDSTNNKIWLSGASYWTVKRGLQLETTVHFLADWDHYKKTWDEWGSPKQ